MSHVNPLVGSIAGLWTARVAADHFEDVLVIEPEEWVGSELGRSNPFDANGDRIEDNAPPRTRVMQYTNSVHGEYDNFSYLTVLPFDALQSFSQWPITH